MKRRDFIKMSALGLVGTAAFAESPGPRRIPYAQNPGLSRLLLERYAEYHRANFFDFKWPAAFASALKSAYAEPRDLAPKIGENWSWPRFQWEHRFERAQHTSHFHWFDFENPAELRALWKTELRAPGGDWCGISYDGTRFITHSPVQSIDRIGFEKWGLKSSNGEITRFGTGGQLCEIVVNDALIYTRRFNARRLNITPGSQEGKVIRKVFADFMMMPSSGALLKDVRLRSIYYP